MDWMAVALAATAGLTLFLFGVGEMSRALDTLAGDRMKAMVGSATNDRFRGIAAGTVATVVLDSSSLTIVLLIALVDAGIASMAQAIPVVPGANIGTTFSSPVFALGIDQFGPVAMLAGFLARTLSKSKDGRTWGGALFGIGARIDIQGSPIV